MKKGKQILLGICAFFLVLTIGIFIGRNSNTVIANHSDNGMYAPASQVTQSSDPRLDINILSEAQLIALPGIGETLAGRIVAYRDQYGPFLSADDLLNVEGIGEAKLEQIIKLIKVGE